MSAESMMRNTCTLTPITEGQSNTSAGLTNTPGSTVTGVQCSIQQAGGCEAVQQFRETGVRSFNCYFPYGTTLAENYLISAITSASGLSGVVLKVKSPPQDHGGLSKYLMVTAEELQQ